jgi:hypothetical protein
MARSPSPEKRALLPLPAYPLGEWNTFWIKMVGDRVSVKLNDKLVVDNAVFLEGKIPAEGPLMLERHRGPVWFRNIFVKEFE